MTSTKDAMDPPAPEPRRTPAEEKEIARFQDLMDTRYMADMGAAEEGWGRRQFLFVSTTLTAFAGLNFFVWPFISSMNPAADVEALATTEVDLAPIEPGQSITAVWRGKPIFVHHRTPEQIEAARLGDDAPMPDPQLDEERVQRPEWLVLVGICLHLGCVPRGQRTTDPKGDFGGWFCPCHGSHFDTSGRVRSGPAAQNMEVPEYTFISDDRIKIG